MFWPEIMALNALRCSAVVALVIVGQSRLTGVLWRKRQDRRLGKAPRAQLFNMDYRRSRQPGGNFFFTLVTHQRQKILTEESNIAQINDAFKREMAKRPFTVEAFVLLPDHLHTMWKLPDGDYNYSTRWSAIKRYFSTGCVGAEHIISESRRQKREKAV